jgi:hypothetical protein
VEHHDGQDVRHGRRRRHRDRDRPPRPRGERCPGARLRGRGQRPARLQRSWDARRRHDRRARRQRARRRGRRLAGRADAGARARREWQRLERQRHRRPRLRLHPRGEHRQREPRRDGLLEGHARRDRGLPENALRLRRRQQRPRQRLLAALPVQLRLGPRQPGERDLRRGDRHERHARRLFELRTQRRPRRAGGRDPEHLARLRHARDRRLRVPRRLDELPGLRVPVRPVAVARWWLLQRDRLAVGPVPADERDLALPDDADGEPRRQDRLPATSTTSGSTPS